MKGYKCRRRPCPPLGVVSSSTLSRFGSPDPSIGGKPVYNLAWTDISSSVNNLLTLYFFVIRSYYYY